MPQTLSVLVTLEKMKCGILEQAILSNAGIDTEKDKIRKKRHAKQVLPAANWNMIYKIPLLVSKWQMRNYERYTIVYVIGYIMTMQIRLRWSTSTFQGRWEKNSGAALLVRLLVRCLFTRLVFLIWHFAIAKVKLKTLCHTYVNIAMHLKELIKDFTKLPFKEILNSNVLF